MSSALASRVLTILAFISVVFFPWPLTMALMLASAVYEPFVPLAVGIFADTLYYAPSAQPWPWFTLAGLLVTALALYLRNRLPVR